LDLLVDPDEHMSGFDLGAIRHELEATLGIPVDVLTPRALPDRWRAHRSRGPAGMNDEAPVDRLSELLLHMVDACERIERCYLAIIWRTVTADLPPLRQQLIALRQA
jgi:hypothetical protein